MKATLSNLEANNITLARLHLTRTKPPQGIAEIAESLIGIHSSRFKSPLLSIVSRCSLKDIKQIHDDLYVSSQFHRLRCMRGTLHILNFEDALLAHKVTLEERLKTCEYLRKTNKIAEKKYLGLRAIVLSMIQSRPMSPEDIKTHIKQLLPFKEESSTLASLVIRVLFEEGLIYRTSSGKSWWNELPVYCHNSNFKWFERLDKLTVSEAQEKLVIKYFKSYGPATVEDAHWWSGIKKSRIKEIINSCSNLVLLRLEDSQQIYFIHSDSLSLPYTPHDYDIVNILPYEDNLLKGYSISRERFVAKKYHAAVYNNAGEANASILVNGLVKGTWKLDQKRQIITVNIFEHLNKKVLALVKDAVIDVASAIDVKCDIKQL